MTEETRTADASDLLATTVSGEEVYVIVQQGGRSWVLALAEGAPVTFGRSRACTVHVDEDRVSRQHARIERRGDAVMLMDLGSRNGTHVAGERVVGERRLRGGDVVAVGSAIAVLAVAGRAAALPAAARPAGAAAPGGERRPATAGDHHPTYVIADPKMAAVYDACQRVASTSLSVLIVGETGVGKENVAEAIHRMSPRAKKPFFRLHLAALPEALLESELFGHERGAFTGAVGRRLGYFESATGGTLFLDEVGELPLSTQAKLLRVLETGRVVRLGSTEEIETDVRIVAATNRDLVAEAAAKRFREDLYFRLCGFAIAVPPLRERQSEIPLLASLFVRDIARRMAIPEPGLDPALLHALERYRWPGNVRELKHAMEAAVVLASPGDVELRFLPEPIRAAQAQPEIVADAAATPAPQACDPLGDAAGDPSLNASERGAIVQALSACGGNQTRAAQQLGISRRTLIYKMRKHDIRTIREVE